MIFYEFECLECEAKFQKDTSDLKISCPGCKSKKVKKLWAVVSNKPVISKACRSSCSKCKSPCA